jgi:hypothetical protein
VGPSEQLSGIRHVVQNQDSLVVQTSDTSEWRVSWTTVRKHMFCGQSFIQGDSVARGPKLLSIKHYVIDIMT